MGVRSSVAGAEKREARSWCAVSDLIGEEEEEEERSENGDEEEGNNSGQASGMARKNMQSVCCYCYSSCCPRCC